MSRRQHPHISDSLSAIIIGDELLSGTFVDTNGPYVIAFCKEHGLRCAEIIVIPDEIDRIADEVARAKKRSDWVITSGGVGPTHDDITYAAVAQAFSQELHLHPQLVALLDTFGLEQNEANRQMARVPKDAELVIDSAHHFPTVRVDNVFVLPGVPSLFRGKLSALQCFFKGASSITRRVKTRRDEGQIAHLLRQVLQEYPAVRIGSYPKFERNNKHVILTITASEAKQVERATQLLAALIDDLEWL